MYFDSLDLCNIHFATIWQDFLLALVHIVAKLNSVSNHKILCVCVENVESFPPLKKCKISNMCQQLCRNQSKRIILSYALFSTPAVTFMPEFITFFPDIFNTILSFFFIKMSILLLQFCIFCQLNNSVLSYWFVKLWVEFDLKLRDRFLESLISVL